MVLCDETFAITVDESVAALHRSAHDGFTEA